LIGEFPSEEITNGKNGDASVLAQSQEVVVAGHNVGSIGHNSTAQENIVIGISNYN